MHKVRMQRVRADVAKEARRELARDVALIEAPLVRARAAEASRVRSDARRESLQRAQRMAATDGGGGGGGDDDDDDDDGGGGGGRMPDDSLDK